MDALSMHFTFQLVGNPVEDKELWDKLLLVPDQCVQDISQQTIVTGSNDADKMVVCSSKNGCHLVMHVYQHNLVTLDIQHVEQPSSHESKVKRYSYKMIKDIEEKIVDILGKSNCQFSRSLPTVLKHGRAFPYFLHGDHTLFEYVPSELVFETDSKWQNIKIYITESFGHVLCLNDDIMLGESDIIYTTTLLGLGRGNAYKDKTVLILGGGDGGLLHKLLQLSPGFVSMVEIDEDVIKACRDHMRGVCGDSLDHMNGPHHTILVDNCLKVLQDYSTQSVKFDYVINDLSEYLLDTDTELDYDFKTSATILELSMQILEPDGKYLSRGNCITDTESLQSFEADAASLGLTCQSFIIDVPSFMEKYCVFEVRRPSENAVVKQS